MAYPTGEGLAQRGNCGNRPPILKRMPSTLKAFINVKKPYFPQFMKMFCTVRVLLTSFPDSGTHPRQYKNLNLMFSPCLRTSPFICPVLDPSAMNTLAFLIKHTDFYFLDSPVLIQVNVTLFPYSSQRKAIGSPFCPREEKHVC